MSEDTRNQFCAISRIAVDNLFGQYTYDLKRELVNSPLSHLFIIYGDNGSGKTTLLELIFHMLFAEGEKGHKTFLGKTHFKKLSIEFENGMSVVAERPGSNLVGTYHLSVRRDEKTVCEMSLVANEENAIVIPPDAEEYKQYLSLLKALADLNLSMYFLRDDRKVWSDLYKEDGDDDAQTLFFAPQTERGLELERAGRPIERAILRFEKTIRQQALQGSNLGEFNVSTIYNEIAKRIASAPLTSGEIEIEPAINELVSALEQQAKRGDAYAKFGLSARLSIGDILTVLSTARRDTLPILNSVLKPYVEGTKARLDALQATYNSISAFVENINEFYSHKQVQFDLGRGLRIFTDGGERLSPNSLSSGEKQLLLLFCNTLSVHQRATIFLIDEPEISLNVKWQRQLVQALLSCIKGKQIQFVLATHSLELLALHRESVVKLIDTGEYQKAQNSHE